VSRSVELGFLDLSRLDEKGDQTFQRNGRGLENSPISPTCHPTAPSAPFRGERSVELPEVPPPPFLASLWQFMFSSVRRFVTSRTLTTPFCLQGTPLISRFPVSFDLSFGLRGSRGETSLLSAFFYFPLWRSDSLWAFPVMVSYLSLPPSFSISPLILPDIRSKAFYVRVSFSLPSQH